MNLRGLADRDAAAADIAFNMAIDLDVTSTMKIALDLQVGADDGRRRGARLVGPLIIGR
ncbi:hypothetical protein D3C83_146360 [compost metagenome]